MDGAEVALQTGHYQLPIYCQTPKILRPVLFEKMLDMERIPCATLLIRVEKAPVDVHGRSISIVTTPLEKRVELGMLKVPPKYSTGMYNNQYINLFNHELKIYSEKAKRVDPLLPNAIVPVMNAKSLDKNLKKKLKKLSKKKKIEEATPFEFLSIIFQEFHNSPEELLDLNFFSQYIPDIGFRFSVDLVYNCDPHMLYVAICSINPPGSIYQEEKTFEKVIMYNEINFESHVKSQKFLETFYAFVNVPTDHRAHMIIDIKSIRFRRKGPTEVKDYAWTIYPIFTTLEIDDNKATKEVFVRSGIYMMPLFQGKVRNDVVQELVKVDDLWGHLMEQKRLRVAPISLLPKSGVIVR